MSMVLDIGNVLCDVNFNEFIKELQDGWEIEEEEIWFFLNRIQPLQDLGHTNMKTELRNSLNINYKDHPQIIEAWNNSIIPNPISIKYLEYFIDRGPVALLSNIGHEHIGIVGGLIGPAYDSCVTYMSCEVGLRKPSLMYYRSFLDQHGVMFRKSFYVDDRHENLATGKKVGLRPYHLDTTLASPEEITAFWEGLKVTMDADY